jgi:hypothetical protein
VPQLQSGGNAAQHIFRQRRQTIHAAAVISKVPIGEKEMPMRLMCLSSWRHRWQAQNFTAFGRWVHV